MSGSAAFSGRHYTLERDNRELQPPMTCLVGRTIIPLREIIGNYNLLSSSDSPTPIIPLRERYGV